MADYELTPDVAIVDPDLVMSLPKSVTADTGMDVLTHALEAYVSNMASDFTDGLAEKAVQLVLENLENAYNDVINSEVMQQVKHRDVEYCKNCEYYQYCKGGCLSRAYLEYGSINEPDAFCYKKHRIKENPLKDLKYTYEHKERKVHENYLCTLIVKPK